MPDATTARLALRESAADALRSIWIEPGPTVRRLVDQGDGGLWVPLLAAEWLAGPLVWLAGRKLSGTVPSGDEPLTGFLGFAHVMGVALFTMAGGLVILRLITHGDLRPRDLALGVAWGLLPILVAGPVLLAVALAARFNASIAFLLALVALGLAFSASWMTLLATIEAGGWSRRPLAAAAVLVWGCVHWGVMTFTWITRMMTWAGFGID